MSEVYVFGRGVECADPDLDALLKSAPPLSLDEAVRARLEALLESGALS